MCFVSKKKLIKLQDSVDELTKIVKTQELVRLREESKELKELKDLLSNVRFQVKDVKAFDSEEVGISNIRITYQLPTIMLTMDDEGHLTKDNFFYSTNSLGLISIEDMKRIQKVINNEKNKKSKKNI